MNNDLFFLCKWNTPREKTWSGTCLSLYKALQSHYKLIDIDIRTPFVVRLLKKLRLISSNEPHQMEIGLFRLFHNHLFIKKKEKKNKLFQFTDFIFDGKTIDTFIYQDLCMTYVDYMAEQDPELFKISGFGMVTPSERKIRSLAEQKYYAQCKGIFVMGQWMARYLTEQMNVNPQKVYHVGGGINVDPEHIKDGKARQGNKILFIGRDFTRKGGDLVYEAFCLLRQRMPNVELHLVGPKTDPVLSPVEGYHFWGEQPVERLPEFFNKCDIFCMPSRFEAYGLVFIEALAFGLPCIGRNAYEMPHFIQEGETGYLIDEDNALLLSQKMELLLSDKKISENVYKRRDQYLREYSWKSVAERIESVIG